MSTRVAEEEIPKIVRSIEDIRIGPKRLTRYERARVIAARALQLAMGAPPLIDVSLVGSYDPVLIAEKELELGVLPIMIKRVLPNGQYQLIPIRVLMEYERPKIEAKRELIKKIFRIE